MASALVAGSSAIHRWLALGMRLGPASRPGRLAVAGRGVSSQELVHCMQETLTGPHRVEQAAGRHGSVAEHDDMPGGRLGGCLANPRQQLGDGVQEPLAMGEDGPVHRVLGIGVLGDGVEEGASAEAR